MHGESQLASGEDKLANVDNHLDLIECLAETLHHRWLQRKVEDHWKHGPKCVVRARARARVCVCVCVCQLVLPTTSLPFTQPLLVRLFLNITQSHTMAYTLHCNFTTRTTAVHHRNHSSPSTSLASAHKVHQ